MTRHKTSALVVRFTVAALLTGTGFLSIGSSEVSAQAVNYCLSDVGGANDEVGQSDITFFCLDETDLPGSFDVSFGFDEIGLSGRNTADGCLLYDSNSNGNVDFALCVSLGGTPLVLNAGPLLYTCNDSSADRCAGDAPLPLSAESLTACSVAQSASDPFPSGSGYPVDTVVSCVVDTDDIPSSGVLANFVTFPSSNPNSAPKDTALAVGSGFVYLTAAVTPDIGTTFTFTLTDGTTTTMASVTGSESVALAVVAGTYALSMSVPAGWAVTAASCLNGTTPVGTFDGIDTVTGMSIPASAFVRCTFEIAQAGTIIIVETTEPAGSPQLFTFTPSYGGGTPFQLSHGQSNSSGAIGVGTYSVSQALPAGWTLLSATCSDGSSVDSINVSAGETVTCTFTNGSLAPVIGAAKTLVSAPEVSPNVFDVTFALVVENLGSGAAPNVQLTEDLATTFAGATSFSVTAGPTVTGGLTAGNGSFNGTSDINLLAGSESLAAGQTATIMLTVRVDTGGNAGPYANQVTVTTAATPGGTPVATDLSDFGSNPDPDGDGNPDEPGENDATGFALPPQTIGAAKQLTSTTQVGPTTHQFAFSLVVENFSPTEPATNVQLTDDLAAAFPGAASITIVAGPAVTGGLTAVNGGFTGTGDVTLLSGTESLAVGQTATVTFTAEVDLDGAGGPFTNQATVTSAATPGGTPIASDLSDDGSNPDPDGDDNPDEPGENDATTISVAAAPVIGAAKVLVSALEVSPNVFDVTFSLVVENLGSVAATNVQLTENLATTFAGATSSSVTAGPTVTGGLTAGNGGFDGDTDGGANPSDINLLAGTESLAAGQTATITLTVQVDTGGNMGPYSNQVTATSAATPGGTPLTTDLSDTGSNPDSDGDGNPDEPGENDATGFTLPPQVVGAAKELTSTTQVGPTTYQFAFSLVVENFSPTEPATNVQLTDDLAAAFPGAASITVVAGPTVTGGLTAVNGGFTGTSDVNLLSGSESLAIGQTATVTFTAEVDLDGASGPFANQATVTSAATPGGTPIASDLSGGGSNPDPDGDNNPSEPGEDDATVVTVAMQAVGAAKTLVSAPEISSGVFDVTFALIVENLGTTPATNVQLTENLATTFAGATSFSVTAGPTVTGGLTAGNGSFNGTSDLNLLAGTESLAAGQTATITLTVQVDTGGNMGPYSNQVTATSAATPGGTPLTTDLSDTGSNPDSDGDGNPDEPGENDATGFTLPPQVVGAAKELTSTTQVGPTTYQFAFSLVVENFSPTEPATNVQLTDDLAAAFPGAASITVVAGPAVTGGLTTVNGGYDGDSDGGANPSDVNLLSGSESLAIGQTATVTFTAEVDLDGASGPFANQATVTSAATPGGTPIASDLSGGGSNPDPDGDNNPSEPGEDDATVVTVAMQAVGAAKTLVSAPEISSGVFDVTFALIVENLGTTPATNVQLTENLATTFAGATSFSVTAGPTVTGGLTAGNGGFNGTSDLNLLAGTESLAAGQTATITLTVQVDTGGNMGPYSNQVTATSAATPGGTPLTTDLSDTGSNPDPDGDGNPDEPGENDATGFTLPPQVVGVAKELTSTTQVGPTTYQFAFSLVVENFSPTEPATNVQLTDDLAAAFPGAASITVVAGPAVTGGLTTVNGGYDGDSDGGANPSDVNLLSGSESLAIGQTATVTFTAEVDLDGASGPFANQATVTSAATPGGTPIASDLSGGGSNPDPDGDNNPSEPGEDDATVVTVAMQVIGAAKTLVSAPEISSGVFDVTFSLIVENLGTTPATNVQLTENLATTFAGATSFSVTAGPTVTGGLTAGNGSFNGTSDLDLLAGTESLAAGQTATITLTVQVDTGGNMGPYSNQVTATSAATPGGTPLTTDLSDTGSNPDPDGDGNPDEPGENDATGFTLPPQVVGASKELTSTTQVGPTTYQFAFSLVVENFSPTEPATNVQLTDDLAAAFPGAANITVVAGPAVTGGLTAVNGGFTGTSDVNLLSGSESLAIGQTATVTFTAEVDLDGASGPFANRATVTSAATPGGTPIASDASGGGSDPDPDGDDNPSEPGEDDATVVVVAMQVIGVAQSLSTVTKTGATTFDVTLSLVVENLGTTPATNVQLTEDLATAFAGATSFSVTAGPTVTGGLTAGNGSFNGTSDLNLLAGTESLAAGQTATITLTVQVDTGGNMGPYTAQATATTAASPGGTFLTTDLSDNGVDPDPDGDGNANEPGENDATGFTLPPQVIGAAKELTSTTQVGPTTYQFAFSLVVENLSPTETATNVQLIDDLAAAFPGAASITIVVAPAVTGGLTAVNGGYDGTSDVDLLSGSESLAPGQTATVTFTAEVDLGGASGPFASQATATTAASPGGPPLSVDPSDSGTDPDPNGNGSANEPGENDPTGLTVSVPIIGAAKSVGSITQIGPGSFEVTFAIVVENLGSVPAANVQVTDDLGAAFGAASDFRVTAGPTISGGLSTANGDFDGVTEMNLLAGTESLAPGQTATITLTVQIDTGDNGIQYGNQVTATSAATPGGVPLTTDLSDAGPDPDPNDNGNPNEPGENDSTQLTLAGQQIGMAKEIGEILQVGPKTFQVEYRLVIENLSGDLPATNVQVVDDLAAAFPGVAGISVTALETGQLTPNGSYDGVTDIELLAGSDTLAPGVTETLTLRLSVDVGEATGPFANQATGTSYETPGGEILSADASTNGADPDPNGNGNPDDAGENTTTGTVLESQRLGVAKQLLSVSLAGPTAFDVAFAFVVENLSGSVTATNIQVVDDLQAAFPEVAGIDVISGPSAAKLTPNPAFDGTDDARLLAGTDRLAPGERDVVGFTVRIDIGSATGPFANQATASAAATPGGPPVVTDRSDDGNDPDPDGDDNPSEDGEDDPTTVVLELPSVLVDKRVDRREAGPGDVLVYAIRAENLGTSAVPGITVGDDLPGGFRFVTDTATLVRSGDDRTLDTPDDVTTPIGTDGVDPVIFGPLDLALGETVEVRYLVQIGSGVARGQFTNRAIPLFEGFVIGNEASAAVDVVADPLVEQTTIIGKVWNDRDGDGWQDDADATGLVLSGGPFGRATSVPDLPGRRRVTDPPAAHAVSIDLAAAGGPWDEPIVLTSGEGTVLRLAADGTIDEVPGGAKRAGRTAQDLRITRTEAGSGDDRQLTLEIRNHGVVEEGIPGVRLSTVEGLTIETDAFGRYHLAGIDVARFERGANFIVKLDPATLPEGSRLTTENPRVLRLTQSLMTRINFGVQLPAAALLSAAGLPVTDESDVLPHSGVVWATEDPLVHDPRLDVLALDDVVIEDDGRIAPVRFAMYSNYDAFTAGWELRIFAGGDTDLVRPLATLAGDAVRFDDRPAWTPADLGLEPGTELAYVLRVHDADGRVDETRPRRLPVVSADLAHREGDGSNETAPTSETAGANARIDADERKARLIYGQSNLARQGIAVSGSRVRVHGADVSGDYVVTVDGQAVPLSDDGSFVFEAQMPVGTHDITVELAEAGGARFARRLAVDVERDYRFLVGLANLTLGQNDLTGSIEPLSGDDHFDGEVFVDGRVAFYARGKIQGKYLITAQLDTTEDQLKNLGDRLGDTDPRRIFRQLDPDRYYPIYGDDSTTTTDVDTQGAFYVRVDFDKNEILWGNFNTGLTDTEFLQYNRSLYGARGRHENGDTTTFGDARTEGTVFVSEAQSVLAHATFLATGGSLYYLRHTGIVEGSEKISVEVRRRDTEQIVERQTLVHGRDYEIDPLQGRILLRRPLNQVVNERGPAIIRSRPLEGDDVFLLVDYEFVPAGFAADHLTYGGRGKLWLGDHLGIGASGVKDERDDVDYELRGLDATLRAGLGTYVTVEYAESEARQTDAGVFSADGGLTFSSRNRTRQGPVIDGAALAFEGRLNLAEVSRDWSGDVRAWWKKRDAGFSIGRLDEGIETRDAGVEVQWQPLAGLSVQGGFKELERAGVARDTVARAQADFVAGAWIAGAELRSEQREDLRNGTTGGATLAGARLGYHVTADTLVYGTAQTVVASDGLLATTDEANQNSLAAIGVNSRLNRDVTVSLEASTGDRGEAVTVGVDYAAGGATHLNLSGGMGGGATSQVGASYAVAEGHDLYGTYTVDPDRTEGPKNTLTFGQRRQFGNSLSIFTEEQFGKGQDLSSSAHVFGLDFAGVSDWVLSGSLQFSDVERRDALVKRVSTSIGAGLQGDDVDLTARFELRHDSGSSTESRQYLTTNAFRWQAGPSHSWQGKLNLSWTDDVVNGGQLARFTELDLGHAYRPTQSDRWNVLAKYSYLYDLSSAGQAALRPDQRSHIVSGETIGALTHRWEVGGKVVFKVGQVRTQREAGRWIDQGLLLGTVRARYHVIDNWDGLVEYRRLSSVGGDDARGGLLIAVYRHLMSQFKVGLGYNFTDFDDDLKDESYTSNGWFFDIIWKR